MLHLLSMPRRRGFAPNPEGRRIAARRRAQLSMPRRRGFAPNPEGRWIAARRRAQLPMPRRRGFAPNPEGRQIATRRRNATGLWKGMLPGWDRRKNAPALDRERQHLHLGLHLYLHLGLDLHLGLHLGLHLHLDLHLGLHLGLSIQSFDFRLRLFSSSCFSLSLLAAVCLVRDDGENGRCDFCGSCTSITMSQRFAP